jgi:hypothetical protein
VRDRHGDDVTRARGLGSLRHLEVDETIVFRAPRQAVRRRVLLAFARRDEHLERAPELLLVLFERDALLERHQTLVTLLHDRLRHLIRHRRGGRALADRVLERERTRESGRLDHAHRVFEVFVGLAGEADDDIGRDRRVRDLLAHPVEDAEELLRPVRATHVLQDLVAPRLQRHVQLRHDVRRLGHRIDHIVGERRGVRTREAHPLEALDLSARAQELAERLPVAELDAVAVHVLAQKRDLDRAVVDEQLDLFENVTGAAVLLLAAQARHDAEGAGVVAADRDRHPPRVMGVSLRRKRRREDLERLEDLERRLAVVARALEELGQRAHVVRSEDHVDPRRLLRDGVLIHLGETAADGDLHAGVLVLHRLQMAERAVELARGVLAHGAGVDDDHVGVLTLGCAYVARALQGTGHALGVVHVHLAPEGAHLVGASAPVVFEGGGRRSDERRGRRWHGHSESHSTESTV